MYIFTFIYVEMNSNNPFQPLVFYAEAEPIHRVNTRGIKENARTKRAEWHFCLQLNYNIIDICKLGRYRGKRINGTRENTGPKKY